MKGSCMNSTLLKTVVMLAMASVISHAVQSPDTKDTRTAMKGASVQALKYGMKGLRRAIVSDLQDASVDGAFSASKGIILKGAPNEAVSLRINKRLKNTGMQVKVISTRTDSYGLKHIRLRQFQNDVPIIGGEVIVHVDKNNRVAAVTGQWAPSLTVAALAAPISTDKAGAAAIAAFPGQALKVQQSPQKVIFNGMMAYEVTVKSTTKEPASYRCYIDAQKGTMLAAVNQILHAGPGTNGEHTVISGIRLADEDGAAVTMTAWHDAGGNYFMYNKDSAWGVFNLNSYDWEQRTTSAWGDSDPAAVSLGRNMASVQNWVSSALGRRSFDDAGALAVANVHEGSYYVNAYWDGSDFHFGDGDGMTAGPLTVLDIVGHEYGHAITQYTSNLVYAYEPGALNESYSDIMGALVEFAEQPDGRSAYPASVNGQSDWLCGEDSWIMDAALRDLRDPQRYGQPSYYLGTNWFNGDDDNGGVHYNSGVQNFAFYLLAEGGSGTNDGHPYSVTGLGIETARDIALYANTYLLTQDAQYRDSRNAWMMAASVMGVDTMVVRDVWTAVGLPPLEKHLEASATNIEFGTVGFGVTDTQWVELVNQGGDTTEVYVMDSDNTHYAVAATLPLKIMPNSTTKFAVTFTPTGYPAESGTLTILSDALDNPVITIALTGSGAPPAELVVDPENITETLLYGDTARFDVVVRNDGEADLKFRADIGSRTISSQTPALLKAAKPATGASFLKQSNRTPNKSSAARTNLKPTIKRVGPAVSVLYLTTILSGPGATDSFTEGMRGLDNVSRVDVLDGYMTTPNLAYLMQYDVVVLSSNYPWADQVALGNTLADYVDNGGSIVMMVASIASGGGYSLSGRIVTEEYLPLQMSGGIAFGKNPRFAAHPITEGVTQLEGDIIVDSRAITGNGVSLGTFDDGSLIGAYNSEKSIVAINIFPYEWYWRGDLIRMMGNTFNWFKQAQWLKVTPLHQPITVTAGQACTLQVTLDARKVFGGTYTSALTLTHNDPAKTNPLTIPCTLNVDGTRMLGVTPAALDFGVVWTDRSRSLAFTIANPGSEPTVIHSIVSSNSMFTIRAATPLTLAPQQKITCMVVYEPKAARIDNATITVTSDAEIDPEQKISLTGTGVMPPVISYTPKKLRAALDPSTSITLPVTFTNTGGADFEFTTTTAYGSSGTGLSSAILYGLYGGFIYRIDPISGEFIGQAIRLDSAMTSGIGMRGLAFDGSYLYASAGYTDHIEVIDPSSGIVTRTLPLPQPGSYSGLGVSSEYLITVDNWSNTVYALDKQTGSIALTWQYTSYGSGGVAYYGARQSVFIAAYNGIEEYRLSDGTLLNRFYAPFPEISGMAFSEAAQALFVTSAWSNVMYALNPTDGSMIAQVYGLAGIDGLAADEAGTGWLKVEPANGIVPAGNSLDLNVTFSSDRVPAGRNTAVLKVVHALDGTPGPFAIPCTLQVAAVRKLSVTPDSIFFAKTWVNYVDTSFITLTNSGSAPTEVQSIQTKGAKFSFGTTLPLLVPAYGQTRVRVFFRPTAVGTSAGQFTFVSNAADNPLYRVALKGTAVKAPTSTPTPATLSLKVLPGDLKQQMVTLTNSGGVEFPFSVRARCSALPNTPIRTAGNPAQAVIYVLSNGTIYQIDPVTGATMDDPIQTSLDGNSWDGGLAYDGRLLYAASTWDSTILVINPFDGQVVRTIALPDTTKRGIDGLGICGQYLVASTQFPPMCHVLDKVSGVEITSWAIPTSFIFHDGGLTGAGPRQSIYIAENVDNLIREFDPLTGAVLREFAMPAFGIRGLAYSSTANLLIGIDNAGQIYYLDPDDGRVISSVKSGFNSFVAGAAADEDGPPVTWLTINMKQGVIAANGGKANVSAEFDTRLLDAGTYIGRIDIRYTGSRSLPIVSVPCTLTVPQTGRLVISPIKVDFGAIKVKTVKTATLTLSNPGNLPTTVSSATVAEPFSCVLTTPLVIAPRGCATATVRFAPARKGTFNETLQISSNATEGSSLSVILKGVGK
jgi:Zn-dependent metalloprotease